MLTVPAKHIQTDTPYCFRTLFAIVVPTAIAWYVARHAIYWIACLLFGIEQQHAPSESKILGGKRSSQTSSRMPSPRSPRKCCL